jgi:hypothetical protein
MSASMTSSDTAAQSGTRFEMLNPQDHRKLRLASGANFDRHFVQIVASEFTAAAACCPILLTKDSTTGNFYVGAMLGFKPGECLLPSASDRGGFQPLNLQRDGFFISGQQIAIDVSNPRFNELRGESLFDEGEQPSAHLRHIQRVLGQLKEGLESTDAFIGNLVKYKLVEQIDIAMNFDNGERLELKGLYTVSLDALHALPDHIALELFRRGDLQRIYIMNASLTQIAVLADKRNRLILGSA